MGLDVLGEALDTADRSRARRGSRAATATFVRSCRASRQTLLAQRLDELERLASSNAPSCPHRSHAPSTPSAMTGGVSCFRSSVRLHGFGLHTMRFSAEGSRSPLNGFLVGVLLGFDSAGAVGVEANISRADRRPKFRFRRNRRTTRVARHEPDVTLSARASDLVTARLGSTAAQASRRPASAPHSRQPR